jgi:hypothetical protein
MLEEMKRVATVQYDVDHTVPVGTSSSWWRAATRKIHDKETNNKRHRCVHFCWGLPSPFSIPIYPTIGFQCSGGSNPFMLCACLRYSFAEMDQSKLITYSIVFCTNSVFVSEGGWGLGDFGVSGSEVRSECEWGQSSQSIFCLSDWMWTKWVDQVEYD